VAARWSFNCAVVLGRGENGEAKRGVGEMKGAAAPNHFATGGEGGLHGGGEQAMVVLSQGGGWLAQGGRRRQGFWTEWAAMLGPKQKRVGRRDGPPWPGGPRWAVVMVGWKNEKKIENNIWASREHGPN
jgi:hypothetical protein